MKSHAFASVFVAGFLGFAVPARSAEATATPSGPPRSATDAAVDLPAFKARLSSVITRHLDSFADSPGRLKNLKGKSAAAMTALAFYRMYEATGNPRYRAAALQLADEILAAMKATKFGVLFIKEKEKGDGEEINGGGPPALGWYASALAYVYHGEKKNAELAYVAGVLDRFPWNEEGWWAATIDIHTGEPKLPMTKPSPINKNAALAMAAGMAGAYIAEIEPALGARLRARTERCIYRQILPAQEADGFWHYNLNGNDPRGKDVFGYFMLTANLLLELPQLTDGYRDDRLKSALEKAGEFAGTSIAPMMEPNRGSSLRQRATPGTPARYGLDEDLKRAFQLGVVLIHARNYGEGIKITDAALRHFPFGERGEEGARAVYSAALMHCLLPATTSR